MIEFLILYKWALLAGLALVNALALMGCHLAARDKAMQTICVGQGATVGTLLGLGVLESVGEQEMTESIFPLLFALGFSALTYVLSDWVVDRKQASKNSYFTAIFAGLLAVGSLVCILFPHLENHMSHVFFGDLATLTDQQSFWGILLSCVVIGFAIFRWREFTLQSFRQATFGRLVSSQSDFRSQILFHFLNLLLLSFSVQFAGFLFTIAGLFLPTTLAKSASKRGVRKHFLLCSLIGSTGTLAGFIISLSYSRLPTVPTAITAIALVGGAAALTHRLVRGKM